MAAKMSAGKEHAGRVIQMSRAWSKWQDFFFWSGASVQTFGLQNVSFSSPERVEPKVLLREFDVFFKHLLSPSPKRVVPKTSSRILIIFETSHESRSAIQKVCTEAPDQKINLAT